MATIQVPRLQSFYFTHDMDEALVFAANKHRTYFLIQDTDAQNLHFWIGDNPPVDRNQWLSLGGSTTRDTLIFPQGVFGPIRIAEGEGVIGEVFIVSNLIEVPDIVII